MSERIDINHLIKVFKFFNISEEEIRELVPEMMKEYLKEHPNATDSQLLVVIKFSLFSFILGKGGESHE